MGRSWKGRIITIGWKKSCKYKLDIARKDVKRQEFDSIVGHSCIARRSKYLFTIVNDTQNDPIVGHFVPS